MQYIGQSGEGDGIGDAITEIPHPGGDIPGNRCAQVAEGNGLSLAVIGIGSEMGGRRWVDGDGMAYRT